MKIYGFMKVRNEHLREGNIYRALANIEQIASGGIICDDASTDGTADTLREFVSTRPSWSLLEIPSAAQDFGNEMAVKEEMMKVLHAKVAAEQADSSIDTPLPDWIYWLDGDEEVRDVEGLKRELQDLLQMPSVPGLRQHYTQLWRSEKWARTDQGFDDGVFLKAWRYRPDLSFNTAAGTHQQQFPLQVSYQQSWLSKVDVIHWGNYGKNLAWKGIQYSGGRGGVDRHIAFGHPASASMATGVGFDKAQWSAPNPTYRYVSSSYTTAEREPKPFTLDEIRRIRSFGGLKRESGLFCVVVPAYNRAKTLPKALDSLIAQTYDRWIAVVLDDGSTDNTAGVMEEYQDKDPRIFYARYDKNRGGVKMNEIGCDLACEFAEYWSRLGSDDWFGPDKLALDAKCLRDHAACYGLYTVYRPVPIHGRVAGFGEICNPPMTPETIRVALLSGRYVVSWANVAVRTEALRVVKVKFGNYVDPSIHSMEDFLQNARLVSLGYDFVWRGPEGTDATPVTLGVAWDSKRASTVLEAIWTQAPSGGASSPDNANRAANDEVITRRLIAELRR